MLDRALPSEVGECLVRVSHAMHVFTFVHRCTFATERSKQLFGQRFIDRTPLAAANGFQDPAN
jgi:hypothetical protein